MNLIKPQLRASRIFMIVAVSVAVACSAADNSFASGAFFGSRGTHFADVNKDGRADAIAVEDSGVWVRISTGTAFSAPENWSHEPFYGTRGTYFADVDGDGRADAIAVTDEAVYVRKSTGADFAPWSAASNWSHEPYYGSVSTQFADVTGDGKADAIAVSGSNIYVRPSRGSDFAPWTGVSWMNFPFDRARSVQFADVCDCSINGVGKRYSADAVIVMDGGVYVGNIDQ